MGVSPCGIELLHGETAKTQLVPFFIRHTNPERRVMHVMKASLHRGVGLADHLDHDYLQREQAQGRVVGDMSHIDTTRTADNRVWSSGKGNSLEERELDLYRKHFGKALVEQNRKYAEKGNHDRICDMERWYKSAQKKPRELILQIGDKDTHIAPEKLEEVFKDFTRQIQKRYKGHLLVTSASLHQDEATPHVHLRSVLYAREGDLKVISQEKALEQMGIPLPHPDKPQGRYNNRTMTYTEELRQTFISIARAHGIEIDDEHRQNRKHLDKLNYALHSTQEKLEKAQDELTRTSQELSDLRTDMSDLEDEYDFLRGLDEQRASLPRVGKGLDGSVRIADKSWTTESVTQALQVALQHRDLQREYKRCYKALKDAERDLEKREASLSENVNHYRLEGRQQASHELRKTRDELIETRIDLDKATKELDKIKSYALRVPSFARALETALSTAKKVNKNKDKEKER